MELAEASRSNLAGHNGVNDAYALPLFAERDARFAHSADVAGELL